MRNLFIPDLCFGLYPPVPVFENSFAIPAHRDAGIGAAKAIFTFAGGFHHVVAVGQETRDPAGFGLKSKRSNRRIRGVDAEPVR